MCCVYVEVIMIRFFSLGVMCGVLLCACQSTIRSSQSSQSSQFPQQLPFPVANNAVAYVNNHGVHQFYSFNGLMTGKTYKDITNQAFVWKGKQWHSLSIPDQHLPVLASTAVTVTNDVYLFGGYTVAADHTEKSVPNVWKINGETDLWDLMPPMPVPVDDTVALVYQDRYVYLVSGWHDVDNVNLVQVFDTEQQSWKQATEFPLPAVFGHAGAIINNQILICDGVKVVMNGNKKQFLPSSECGMGLINETNPLEIEWQKIAHHSGTAYYRMAAVSDYDRFMYFFAGSNNPYNYNGIGYDDMASKPSADVRIYDVKNQLWQIQRDVIPGSMDHRSALLTPVGMAILGGLGPKQEVLNRITYYKTN